RGSGRPLLRSTALGHAALWRAAARCGRRRALGGCWRDRLPLRLHAATRGGLRLRDGRRGPHRADRRGTLLLQLARLGGTRLCRALLVGLHLAVARLLGARPRLGLAGLFAARLLAARPLGTQAFGADREST